MTIDPINETLKKRKEQLTVNNTVNGHKDINNTDNCIPVKEEYKELEEMADSHLQELQFSSEYIADKLSRELSDEKSKGYYLLLAKNTSADILFEALSFTKLAYSEGTIRSTKWAYFRGILSRKGIQTIFKK